jgi:hypothetical protein
MPVIQEKLRPSHCMMKWNKIEKILIKVNNKAKKDRRIRILRRSDPVCTAEVTVDNKNFIDGNPLQYQFS